MPSCTKYLIFFKSVVTPFKKPKRSLQNLDLTLIFGIVGVVKATVIQERLKRVSALPSVSSSLFETRQSQENPVLRALPKLALVRRLACSKRLQKRRHRWNMKLGRTSMYHIMKNPLASFLYIFFDQVVLTCSCNTFTCKISCQVTRQVKSKNYNPHLWVLGQVVSWQLAQPFSEGNVEWSVLNRSLVPKFTVDSHGNPSITRVTVMGNNLRANFPALLDTMAREIYLTSWWWDWLARLWLNITSYYEYPIYT